ncbi:two-component system sensor histidine kinase NtrB [Thiovibrio sp. JS02]
MLEKKSSLTPPFAYASPWILAAAIGMLIAIVIVFAVNNLQREKRIMTESLINKGEALIHLVGAGSRASMMMGITNSQQVQHLIEQASGEANILYIAVVDGKGKVIAHSNPAMINSRLDHPLPGEGKLPPATRHQIITDHVKNNKVFEVMAPFKPFHGGRGQFFRRQMLMRQAPGSTPEKSPQPMGPGSGCQNFIGNGPFNGPFLEGNLQIVVGLDMAEQEKVIREDLYHMVFMSIAMLLVAIGGWIALLTAQSYRSSQKTLMNMQAFTDLLISRLPVGIIATNTLGQVQTFNQAAATLLGKNSGNILGQPLVSALPDFFQALPELAQAATEIIDRELSWPPESTSAAHLHVSSVPIADKQGAHLGRVTLIYDLSEVKRLEAQIRRHDRLVALGKMAAGVAHEVRNPLSSIKGFATLLGSRFAEQSEEKEAANLMIHEVERLNRSITELLTYARPHPLHIEEVEIEPFIAGSLKLIQSDAKALGVEVGYDLELTRKKIPLDRDRLNQVLLNLYLNSLQAMEEGGSLRVVVREGSQEGTMEIRVEDTGHGIAEDIIERVLDPYFTTKPDGTGLGLAMVYKLIDEHGGNLRISSREQEGTTVSITLPV